MDQQIKCLLFKSLVDHRSGAISIKKYRYPFKFTAYADINTGTFEVEDIPWYGTAEIILYSQTK